MHRLIVLPAILFFVALCVGNVAAETVNDGGAAPAGPFQAAAYVPADVNIYVHVRDAAALRDELGAYPILGWFHELIDNAHVSEAWTSIAEQVGFDSERLFDRALGRAVTIVQRERGEPDATDNATISEWAIITQISPRRITRLLERLEPRALRPQHSAAVFELPEHELMLARRGNQLFIAPMQRSELLKDVLRLINEPGGERLAGVDAMRRMPEINRNGLDDARLGMYVRHAPPLGGWSIAAADLDGQTIRLRHAARFDASPFSRQPTGRSIDPGPLALLEDHALIAIIEPTDIGGGPLETFFAATVGEGLLSAAMRRRIGDRRIIVLGEIEGRQEQTPIDLQAPTIAITYEMDEAEGIDTELSKQMIRLAEGLNRFGAGRFKLDVPTLEALLAGDQDRSVDLSPAMRWLIGEMPIAQPMSLNWGVSEGPNGTFCIIASHPTELRGILTALQRERVRPEAHDNAAEDDAEHRGERYQHCGVARGARIAHHLESWIEQSPALAEPGREEQFKATLRMLASLGRGIDRVRWRIARPDRNDMVLEVNICLTPPESTVIQRTGCD